MNRISLKGVHCPRCRTTIEAHSGATAYALQQLVELRSRSLGTEMTCQACHHVFLHLNLSVGPGSSHDQRADNTADVEAPSATDAD